MPKSIAIMTCPTEQYFLLMSDVHFDNPKCDRNLLRKHLDEAVKRDAKVLINGDLFCVMQGLTDKRHSKGDILPQHLGPNYFDLILEDATAFFKPYAKHIALVGYGNHETSVTKRGEHDILQNFVYRMKHEHGADIHLGGYGGWIVIRQWTQETNTPVTKNLIVKYYHGSGGGGAVTKGTIGNQRRMASVQGADVIWTGHVHELHHHLDMAEQLVSVRGHGDSDLYEISHKQVHHVTTAGYKEEYGDGSGGYHIEKGRPPKPLGSYWMHSVIYRKQVDNQRNYYRDVTFTMAL